MNAMLFVLSVSILFTSTVAFFAKPVSFHTVNHLLLKSHSLSTAGMESIELSRIDTSNEADFGRYRVNGSVSSRQLNIYIRDYKDEMKRKKVIIPGFRPGNVPPHAMPEIRSFVVNFALEQVLNEICVANNLLVCDEQRKLLNVSNETTLPSLVIKDSKDRDFIQQRVSWREGSSFPFTIEFYGISKPAIPVETHIISSNNTASAFSSSLPPTPTELVEGLDVSGTDHFNTKDNIIEAEIVET